MITHEQLVQLLSYDPDTGQFTWLKNTSLKNLVGKVAGSINSTGYVNMSLLGKKYSGHRLAWFYVHKKWPENNIDHIDGNRANNRISNLRDVSQSLNVVNARTALPKSGFKGVRSSGSRWRAYAENKGKYIGLGTYDTPEEAHAAYIRYTESRYENTTNG